MVLLLLTRMAPASSAEVAMSFRGNRRKQGLGVSVNKHTHITHSRSHTQQSGLPVTSDTRPESEHMLNGLDSCLFSFLAAWVFPLGLISSWAASSQSLGNHFSLLTSPVSISPESHTPSSCSLLTRPHTQSRGLHQPAPPEVGRCGELLPGPRSTQHLFPHQRAACAGDVWELQHRWALLPCGELFSRCQVSYGCDFMESSCSPSSHHAYELASVVISFRASAPYPRRKRWWKGRSNSESRVYICGTRTSCQCLCYVLW